MNIEQKELSGEWQEYTLHNDHGVSVSVLNYGGIITKLLVPDRDGQVENIVLGYTDYDDYRSNANYFGALIGRVAGRIQEAQFELDGKTYPLEANQSASHLHGGSEGFHQVVWNISPFQTADTAGLVLTHTSLDGQGGYPGNVEVTVTYTLTNDNQLLLNYEASSDQTTVLTLTNHSYFNLSGELKNTVHDQQLTIASSKFAELDPELIPTGKLLPVEDTLFDFRKERRLGDGFTDDFEQNQRAGSGYDHYFIFDDPSDPAGQGSLYDPASGRRMTVETDQPGMVLYTANGLSEGLGLAGNMSRKYLGVCFETQGSPASLHHSGFPDIRLPAGKPYSTQTVFTFRTN